jgi:membrane associated rhomboid family serine protease
MLPLRDANPRHGIPVVTWILVAINVAVFVYQLRLGDGLAGARFILEYAFIPARFVAEPAAAAPTLVTSAFMHGGLLHLGSNMVFLLVFGDNVEERMGKVGYLIFYLLGAAVATGAHGLLGGVPTAPLVGASGAVSAVLGAYIVLFPHQRVMTFIPPLIIPWIAVSLFMRVPRFYVPWLPAWLFIGYWALLQFWEASAGITAGPPADGGVVAWWAHVGGFAFGLVTVRLFARAKRANRVV